jgi:hypothetical protein
MDGGEVTQYTNGLRAGRPGVRIPERATLFCIPFSGVKLPGREAEHSRPPNVEVQNGEATPPLPHHIGMSSRHSS